MKDRKTNTPKFDEAALAKWVEEQKRLYKRGKLEARQIDLLERIPGWTWNQAETNEAAKAARRRLPRTSRTHTAVGE